MERHDGVLLDDHSLEILRVVCRRDGASTTDLRICDGVDIEDNDRIRTRMQKLSDAGLVTVSDAEYSVGGHPPKVATIADQQAVDDLLGNPGRGVDVLAGRVEQLERDADELEDIVTGLAMALDELDVDVEKHLREADRR